MANSRTGGELLSDDRLAQRTLSERAIRMATWGASSSYGRPWQEEREGRGISKPHDSLARSARMPVTQ